VKINIQTLKVENWIHFLSGFWKKEAVILHSMLSKKKEKIKSGSKNVGFTELTDYGYCSLRSSIPSYLCGNNWIINNCRKYEN